MKTDKSKIVGTTKSGSIKGCYTDVVRCLVWLPDWERWAVRYWTINSINNQRALGYKVRIAYSKQLKLF